MSDLARSALGALLTGIGDPLALRPNLLPTRPARAILGVLVRFGAGCSVEKVRAELEGQVDAVELEAELSRCLTADFPFSEGGFTALLERLGRDHARRTLKSSAGELVARLEAGETPDAVAPLLTEMLEATRPENVADEVQEIGANMHELFIGTDARAVPLGLASLEPLKVVPGELCVMAARPGVGKSALLGTVALAASQGGWRPLFLSLEMPARQLRQRFIAALCDIPLGRVMRPDGTELVEPSKRLAALPMGIRDAIAGETLTVERIGALAHAYKARHPEPLVVLVDYLQLVRSREKYERRYELIGHVCRELKGIALREGVPVITAAQLGRGVEQRGKEARPQLSDLRESGDIENTADQVLLMHRPFGEVRTAVAVAKYRMGEPFSCEVDFRGDVCAFVEAERVTRDDWQ